MYTDQSLYTHAGYSVDRLADEPVLELAAEARRWSGTFSPCKSWLRELGLVQVCTGGAKQHGVHEGNGGLSVSVSVSVLASFAIRMIVAATSTTMVQPDLCQQVHQNGASITGSQPSPGTETAASLSPAARAKRWSWPAKQRAASGKRQGKLSHGSP